MNISKSFGVACSLIAALAILASCGEARKLPSLTNESTSSFPFQKSHDGRTDPLEKSWMLPEAKRKPNLLYISNGNGTVTAYTYSNGNGLSLIGTLTGFSEPTGMCTDKSGNIWITDAPPFRGHRDRQGVIYEYQHGGTVPIETIKLGGQTIPNDCAVDPTTGDLAVLVEQHGKYGQDGYVLIYPKGSRAEKIYSTGSYSEFADVYFGTYDNAGNLYVDGNPCAPSNCFYGNPGPPTLFKLSKGGSVFMPLTLSGATLVQPSAVSWINPALLLGDRDFQGQGTSGAYKVLVSGSTATVVGTLPFSGTQEAFGFWLRAGRVIVPDVGDSIVRIYNLSDGTLYSQLTTDIVSPYAAVVSQ